MEGKGKSSHTGGTKVSAQAIPDRGKKDGLLSWRPEKKKDDEKTPVER